MDNKKYEMLIKLLANILKRQDIMIEQISSLSRAFADVYDLPIENGEVGEENDV